MLRSARHGAQLVSRGTEMDVGPARVLVAEGVPVRQLVVIIDGCAVATAGGKPIEVLRGIVCLGWPEIGTAAPALTTVATTTAARLLVFKASECGELTHGATSVQDVIARVHTLLASNQRRERS